ncbi:MAG: hypothetical protein JWQ23_440, partial [Herminiimonas sp.]|nr:hypothetical protein [Herminiimonas sp.]
MHTDRIQGRRSPSQSSNFTVSRHGNPGGGDSDRDSLPDPVGMPTVFPRNQSDMPVVRLNRSPEASTSATSRPRTPLSPERASTHSSQEEVSPSNSFVALWDEVGPAIHGGSIDEQSVIRMALGRLSDNFWFLDEVDTIDKAITRVAGELVPEESRLLRQALLGLHGSPDPRSHGAYEVCFAVLGVMSMTGMPKVGSDFKELRQSYLERLARFISASDADIAVQSKKPTGGESSTTLTSAVPPRLYSPVPSPESATVSPAVLPLVAGGPGSRTGHSAKRSGEKTSRRKSGLASAEQHDTSKRLPRAVSPHAKSRNKKAHEEKPDAGIAASPDGGERTRSKSTKRSLTRTATVDSAGPDKRSGGEKRRSEKNGRPKLSSSRRKDKVAPSSAEKPASSSPGKAGGTVKLSNLKRPDLRLEFMPVSAQTPDEKPAKKKSPVKRSLNPNRRSAPDILQKPFDAEKMNKPRDHPDYRVTQPERAKAFAASSVSRLWSDKKTDLQRLIRVPGAYQAVQAVLSQLPADFQWDAVDAIDAVELA